MDSTCVILAARALGVRLTVTKDDGLLCEPASLLTPELREAIRANREALLYDVLMYSALRYVAVEHHVEGADIGAALDAHEAEINDAYLRDWPAYRAAIRSFVLAGREENERARRLDLPSASSSARTLVKGANS